MNESPLKAVLKQNYKLLLTYLFSLTLFFVFRFVYFLRFGEDGLISNYTSDFIYAFWMGIRFDTVILLYVFALVFVFNLFFFIKF
ncbi:MAG: hypothetical protein HC831_12070 [Chloroflexia bacterium]|nr:hypothetical protein [Chloroflexia bacterium]